MLVLHFQVTCSSLTQSLTHSLTHLLTTHDLPPSIANSSIYRLPLSLILPLSLSLPPSLPYSFTLLPHSLPLSPPLPPPPPPTSSNLYILHLCSITANDETPFSLLCLSQNFLGVDNKITSIPCFTILANFASQVYMYCTCTCIYSDYTCTMNMIYNVHVHVHVVPSCTK